MVKKTAKEALGAYEARRNFDLTSEPRDDTAIRPSKRLRFVVQRHDATRLHFDLRLEVDGVFKSWAVAKGPSLNPADKRLAIQTEDHPLSYGDFEGTIPKGQYGGGTVQLFDRGYWAGENGDPAEALANGELKFELDGQHLNGSFVLVRMKSDKFARSKGKPVTNWLLIKHRDANAVESDDGGGILAIDKSVASGRAMATIAAGQGRGPKPFMLAARKGATADAVWHSNRAGAGKGSGKAKAKADAAEKRTEARQPLPTFVAPQLCAQVAVPPSGPNWFHEIKFDGYRLQIRVENGQARVATRRGHDWTRKFSDLADAASRLPDCLIDGELVALDEGGRPSFSKLQAAIANGRTTGLVFFAFDLLHREGRDLREQGCASRKASLQSLLARLKDGQIRFVEAFAQEGADVLASARELGLEGTVSKKTDAPYRSGRTETWLKAKCRPAQEVVIGAWTEKDGKFRSLLGGVYRDNALVYVGRIGTGFGRQVVDTIMPTLRKQASATSPFDRKSSPPRDREIRWLKPVLVAEIEFAGWTGDGTMRQASFKGLREDKHAADVVTELPLDAQGGPPPGSSPTKSARDNTGSAKPTASTTRGHMARGTTVMGITLSKPDKALWPDDGSGEPVTKGDLARYFEAVASWLFPHVAGRPCSIIRAPDGIDGQTFFQRHAMAGGSKLLEQIVVSGDRKPYLVLNEIEALAAVAQSGGIELHPSNCMPGEPEMPGRLIFDLDPAPDVEFPAVVKAAKELKAVLDELGLEAFCKTTGGKGLHVVTPLAPPRKTTSWKATKAFAKDVCTVLERVHPDRFLTKQSKAARTGKIYLDYLRNDRLSTAVAPLSPRGRPFAPVSMPIAWSQVRAGLDPSRYTVRSVPALLAKSTAWKDYDRSASSLSDAITRLARL